MKQPVVGDDLRGGYKTFLDSPTGKDFLERLKMTEAAFQVEGHKSATLEGKGIAMAKMGVIYQLRTMLDDLSQPSKKPAGPQMRSAGPDA